MSNGGKGWLYRSPFWRWRLRGATPAAIQVEVPYAWPANRIAAEALLDGSFLHGGQRFPIKHAPWAAVASYPDAAAALHSFRWLVDLRAHGARAGQLMARALIDDWIASHGRWSWPAWRDVVLARRLNAWLGAADFVLADADDSFQPRFLRSAAFQARHLAHLAASEYPTVEALTIAKARLYAAFCLNVGSCERTLAAVVAQVERQVLADGGHVQRSPALLLAALRDVIDVCTVLAAVEQTVPEALNQAQARMAQALRACRMGDGHLANFNGGQAWGVPVIDAAMARTAGSAPIPDRLPDSGFHRLAAGPVVVIVDTGMPPPPGLDGHAHAGLGAFEMSVGSDAVVVNAGSLTGEDVRAACALRRTDAHSTLVVNASDVWPIRADGTIGDRPRHIAVDRQVEDGAARLELSHDAWQRRFNVIHRRRLRLSAEGDEFGGEDGLSGPGSAAFRVHFRLHPDVRATVLPDRHSARLRTRNGAGLLFQASGGTLSVEDGVFAGESGRPRRTSQLVIDGSVNGNGTTVKWAFRQEGRR